MEQGRARTFHVHLDELARQTAAYIRNDRQLIGNTANRGGLVVRARLDRRRDATGKKVTEKEFRQLKIEPNTFQGDSNYVIRPRTDRR